MLRSIVALFTLGSVSAHMAMTEPAPRRSPYHPGYHGTKIDYDMTSPLGDGRAFPCRGAAAGPIYKTYKAGSDINVHLAGIAKHNGGHCQFSMTYDQVNFAVLKTVMGDCIIKTVDYKVLIPNDAPNGNVTFVWTWFNRMGNREIYMNCADIEITGGSNAGSIKGKKMVVANWPGYPTFPEGFKSYYAKELYETQPVIAISPKVGYTPPTIENISQPSRLASLSSSKKSIGFKAKLPYPKRLGSKRHDTASSNHSSNRSHINTKPNYNSEFFQY